MHGAIAFNSVHTLNTSRVYQKPICLVLHAYPCSTTFSPIPLSQVCTPFPKTVFPVPVTISNPFVIAQELMVSSSFWLPENMANFGGQLDYF